MPSNPCGACGAPVEVGRSQCRSCKAYNDPEPNLNVHGFTGSLMLDGVVASDVDRIETGPWDFAFGGGIVQDSVTLIGGEPGAGKSTLALHMCNTIAAKRRILYVATEEAPGQIKGRADRLGIRNQDRIRVVFPGSVSEMESEIKTHNPEAIILDSLPGLVGYDEKKAVKVCEKLKRYSIEWMAPAIIIDHVNKEKDLAGLMRMQHVVDTVMTFRPKPEGRILMAEKNRHGPAYVECWLSMDEHGLAIMAAPKK